MKKQLYKLFPAIPKVNLYIGQTIYGVKLKLNRQSTITKLSAMRDVYANVGCGDVGITDGWVNIDYMNCPTVTHSFDCKKSLPLADNSAKAIYTEHFLSTWIMVPKSPTF